MAATATQTPDAPTTAAQVLDAPTPSPAKTPAAGASSAAADPAARPGEDKLSPKLQVLIQRERAAVQRERDASAKEASAIARAKEIETREARLTEFETLKQTNPLKALEMLGLSYQDLTQIALADGNITPDVKIQKVEDKFNSFLKSQEEEKRQLAEASQKQEEQRHAQTIERLNGEIGAYLKENAARYELIEFEQNQDLVYDVIDEHYNRTLQAAVKAAEEAGEETADIRGEVMTIAQAADKVEAHLEKKYDKARDLSKVKALMAPRPPARPSVDKLKIPPSQTPKTLNNQLSATPAAPRKAPLTDDERVAKAIAYARGLRTAA